MLKQSESITRRSFVAMTALGAVGLSTSLSSPSTAQSPKESPPDKDLKARWQKLDDAIRGWWDGDLRHANEEDIRNDAKGTLLYLPHPYVSGGGSESAFPEAASTSSAGTFSISFLRSTGTEWF